MSADPTGTVTTLMGALAASVAAAKEARVRHQAAQAVRLTPNPQCYGCRLQLTRDEYTWGSYCASCQDRWAEHGITDPAPCAVCGNPAPRGGLCSSCDATDWAGQDERRPVSYRGMVRTERGRHRDGSTWIEPAS